jgi:hypothetical protein
MLTGVAHGSQGDGSDVGFSLWAPVDMAVHALVVILGSSARLGLVARRFLGIRGSRTGPLTFCLPPLTPLF